MTSETDDPLYMEIKSVNECQTCQLCLEKPFWKLLSFEEIDILKVFIEQYHRGNYSFTLPQFRQEFNISSKLLKKVVNDTFRNFLTSLEQKEFVIRLPRYRIYGQQFSLYYTVVSKERSLKNVRLYLTSLQSSRLIFNLVILKKKNFISFYYDSGLFNNVIFMTTLNSLGIVVDQYYLSPPIHYDENRDYLDKEPVYSLNLKQICLIQKIIEKVGESCPFGLHKNCYNIIGLLETISHNSLTSKEIAGRLNKCKKGVDELLSILESYSLVKITTPEMEFHESRSINQKTTKYYAINWSHPLNSPQQTIKSNNE